jgi:hypothetical protein
MRVSNPQLDKRINDMIESGIVSESHADQVCKEFFSKLKLNDPDANQAVFISPNTALFLLAMSGGNRDISPTYISRFEQDIIRKVFKKGASSWIIDEDWFLTNGHHRGISIVSCNIGMEQYIRIGVEKKEAKMCDNGKDRSSLDTIAMTDEIKKSKLYTKTNLSTARIALTHGKSSNGVTWTKISQESHTSIIDLFREEFEFFGDMFKDVIHSSISAVFLKAYPYFKEQNRLDELKIILSGFTKGKDSLYFFNIQDEVPNRDAIKSLLTLFNNATKPKYERGGTVEKNQFFRTSNLLYAYFMGQERTYDNVRENDEFRLRSDVRQHCLNLKENVKEQNAGQLGFNIAFQSALMVLPDGEYTFPSMIKELKMRNPKLNESVIRRVFTEMKKRSEKETLISRNREIRFVKTEPQIGNIIPKRSKYSWMNETSIFISRTSTI